MSVMHKRGQVIRHNETLVTLVFNSR